MADTREMRQQELARLLLQEEAGFNRRAGARLAEEFIEWAHGVIERPVKPQGAEDS